MTNPLTPHEIAQIEKRAYSAWLDITRTYDPPPEAQNGDLIHENVRVMDILTRAVGLLPALLGLIMLASIVVSLDKTAAAFEYSVANKRWLFGAWSYIVALMAVVMADGALVVAEFALVRDMLSKNLHRETFTLLTLRRGWRVFVGQEPARDWHEMPDPTLRFYVRFLFTLVLAANVFAVSRAGHITGWQDVTWGNGLLIFTGVAGALSLRLVGKMTAHIAYELARKRERVASEEMFDAWRREMTLRWQDEKTDILPRLMHEKFTRKNGLPLEAGSPYLLMTGEDDEIELVPLAMSSVPVEDRTNGRRYD